MTWTKPEISEDLREHREFVLRSAIVSAFWGVVHARRDEGMKLVDLAARLAKDKSAVSRWFSGPVPNWSLKTISDLANALDVDVEIRLRDRSSGEIYTPTGRKSANAAQEGPPVAAE